MLKLRVITAVFLISGFLLALLCSTGWIWGGFCFAFTLIGAYEWAKLIKLGPAPTIFHLLLTVILGVLMVYAFNTPYSPLFAKYQSLILSMAALVWLLIVPAFLFFERLMPQHPFIQSLLGIVILIGNLAAFLGLHAIAPLMLLAVIATVSIADSAAYFGGKQFGRHKLAPTVSPGKTWEGVFSALIAVVIYAAFLNKNLNYSDLLILGLVGLVCVSVMGDLFESKLKRQANLKDSGNILPGHGGVLDRIDGIMPATTLTFFYISILL